MYFLWWYLSQSQILAISLYLLVILYKYFFQDAAANGQSPAQVTGLAACPSDWPQKPIKLWHGFVGFLPCSQSNSLLIAWIASSNDNLFEAGLPPSCLSRRPWEVCEHPSGTETFFFTTYIEVLSSFLGLFLFWIKSKNQCCKTTAVRNSKKSPNKETGMRNGGP